MHIISKPTSRELRERLAESRQGTDQPHVRGVVRRVEEAFDLARRLEREGEAFTKPFAVSGDAPESKVAEMEMLTKSGISPEVAEKYIHDTRG